MERSFSCLVPDISTSVADYQKKGISSGHEVTQPQVPPTNVKEICSKHFQLCGRTVELSMLDEARVRIFARWNVAKSSKSLNHTKKKEMVFIQGHAGSGKTALALTLRAKVHQEQLGLWLSGKFELGKNQDPYAVFVSACTELVEDLLGGDVSRLTLVREAGQTVIGIEANFLTRMIPALTQLLCTADDEKSKSYQLPAADALRRFQSVFCRFLHAVSTVVPLVLFIDDLQWADKASLELLQAILLSQSSRSSLLIVGAYRHDEIFDDGDEAFSKYVTTSCLLQKPPFYFFLRDLFLQSSLLSPLINLTKIHLSNLDEDATNDLVAQALMISKEEALPLARVVYRDSSGNPFNIAQNLLSLSERGLLYHDSETGRWTWDENAVAKELHTESPEERVFRKMNKMQQSAQTVLRIAALMGDEVDETALVMVVEDINPSCIVEAFELAKTEGIVTYSSERGRYRFTHDNIRQAVLSTIDDKDALSFKIGYTMWQRLPPLYFDSKIFTVASLMQRCVHTVRAQRERYQLAALYLEAGLKASTRFDFPDSSLYLEVGIECLQGGEFWSDEYELSLNLFNAAADIALCNQNYSRVSELVAEVHEHARIFKDKIPSLVAQINSFGQRGSVHEAISLGMDVLQQLGEPLPHSVTKLTLITELVKAKIAFWSLSKESILTLPPMQKEEKIAAMNIMSILLPYAYQAGSNQVVLIGARLSRLCLCHGLHKAGALGFVTYGWIVCSLPKRPDRQKGYEIGNLAISLVQHTKARELLPRSVLHFNTFVHHWKCPLRESLDALAHAAQNGMEIGDIESATIALRFQCAHSLFCGKPLGSVEQMVVSAARQMTLLKQDNMHQLTMPFLQFIHNLTGEVNGADELFHGGKQGDSDSLQLAFLNLGLQLAFLWGEHELVEHIADRKRKLKNQGFALYSFTICRLVEALSAVARIRLGVRKRSNFQIAMRVLKQMKGWAFDAPSNFLHKQLLLEAELKSLQHRNSESTKVVSLYVKAIEGAMNEQFTNEAAVGCELLGDYMKRKGDLRQAKKYWTQGHDLYIQWGAKEKARRLMICMHSFSSDNDDFSL